MPSAIITKQGTTQELSQIQMEVQERKPTQHNKRL